jgi:plastocyanin
MRIARVLMALAAVALLGAACGGGGEGGDGPTTGSVTMRDDEFDPADFTASSDTVTVTNEGQAVHSFTVEDGGIDEQVQAGDSAEVDLSGLETGTHDLTCTFHPVMTGSVTVA